MANKRVTRTFEIVWEVEEPLTMTGPQPQKEFDEVATALAYVHALLMESRDRYAKITVRRVEREITGGG